MSALKTERGSNRFGGRGHYVSESGVGYGDGEECVELLGHRAKWTGGIDERLLRCLPN
jgi:hypothetical protein